MEIQTLLFYFFSAVLLFSAFRVITARNPVHAVLYLMLAFTQASAIWLILKAEFLAITLVLVYLGAVMVLFLFVVMMLNVDMARLRQGFWKHFPLAALVGVVFAVEIAYVLFVGFDAPIQGAAPMDAPANLGNTKALGLLLYSEYLYPLQIAAVLLLVAIISAIALTLRERKDYKFVNPAKQIAVRAQDRLSVISVAPTAPAAAPVAQAPADEATAAPAPEKKA